MTGSNLDEAQQNFFPIFTPNAFKMCASVYLCHFNGWMVIHGLFNTVVPRAVTTILYITDKSGLKYNSAYVVDDILGQTLAALAAN